LLQYIKQGILMMGRRASSVSLFLVILTWAGFGSAELTAQQASLQGIVTDHDTGRSLYQANIFLQWISEEERIMGTAADGQGFYRIGSIDSGNWVLRVSYVGYAAYVDTLEFTEGESRTLNLTLQRDDAFLDEVVVAVEDGAAWRIDGAQRISTADIRRVPGPASGNLVTYLQTLPGVVASGDRGGQLFVRGGSPSQNMVLVDGAMIYQPSHIVGFFSPFPESLIDGADFYAGGFGPAYSGRLSSVLDVRMRHGNRFSPGGTVTISPFAASLFAEGPIKTGHSSWVTSVSHSLIEQSSTYLPIENQPLKFENYFTKASLIRDNTRCSVMLLGTYDRGQMDFELDETVSWRNTVFGSRCMAMPEGSATFMDVNLSYSRFTNRVANIDMLDFNSNISRVNLEFNLRQFLGDIQFDYGIYTRLKSLYYDVGEKFTGIEGDESGMFIIGAHIESTIPVGRRLRLQPGIAISLNPGMFGTSAEPRFRFTWQPFGRESEEITGAVGRYLQPITGVSDMRDASSVFVAWMNSPLSESQAEAIHVMLGWQQTPAEGLTWSAEGYYKQMKNLAIPLWSMIARFTTELGLSNGEVFGSDIRFEYNRGRFYGMISYGFSRTLYTSAQDHFNVWFGEPVQDFHPPHDRRHQINTLFSIDLGSFTAGVRWQMGTGMPFTRPMGFDDILDFRERLPDVNTDRGTRRVVMDKPYQGRLPTIHRLDVTVERAFRFSDSGPKFNLQAGAINLYDQSNIFYYDVFTQRRLNQLSFVPYLTMQMEIP
jgi:hypothetical protein